MCLSVFRWPTLLKCFMLLCQCTLHKGTSMAKHSVSTAEAGSCMLTRTWNLHLHYTYVPFNNKMQHYTSFLSEQLIVIVKQLAIKMLQMHLCAANISHYCTIDCCCHHQTRVRHGTQACNAAFVCVHVSFFMCHSNNLMWPSRSFLI